MRQPNIIVIVSDDHGYGDLSCLGSETVRTPNLDRLARDGALLRTWYSNSPVCSPSRASLLSGRYPGNAGVRSILQGYRTTPGLPPQTTTIATALREQGYRTRHVGKWHLGLTRESRPEAHGFDHSFGHLAGAVDYYSHMHYSPNNRRVPMNGETYVGTPLHDLWEDGQEVHHDGRYLTELIGERAVEGIRKDADSDRPFFHYVAFNAPHYPMHAPERYKDRFRHLPWPQMIVAAMLSAMDDAIGQMLDELHRNDIVDDTIVIYMSDNGPSREIRNWIDGTQSAFGGSSAGNLKGHKFSLFEGGIRVPGIVSWPSRIPSGQHIDEPLAAMDLFPTLLRVAGGDPDDFETDGEDILAVLEGGAQSPHHQIFWEQGEQVAVRQGPWKLVLNGQLVEEEPAQDAVFLSNLIEDPSESTNLAAMHPQLVSELTAAVHDWHGRIEKRWHEEWLPHIPDHDTHVFPAGVSK